MPLFEILTDSLVPFRQLRVGAELYESEIESLFFANPEEFTGEPLFCVARQPAINTGGRPDVVALDADGRVVVVEVKRDVDRRQLAQCLEYAGWARSTNLDQLAVLYHRGADRFFTDWMEFRRSTSPLPINRSPRLILFAREFDVRTRSAFDFLIENGLPVKLVPISLYRDERGRKFLDVDAPHEPEFEATPSTSESTYDTDIYTRAAGDHAQPTLSTPTTPSGRRVAVTDLLDAGLLGPNQKLTWFQPRVGRTYSAIVTENGSLALEDGREFASPSRAAHEASVNHGFYDGWECWRIEGDPGRLLADLRRELLERRVK